MGQNNDRIAVILPLPPMNPQDEALARFQTLPITLVTWQIHGMGCGPHRRNDAVRAGKMQVIGAPGAEIRDANRGSGLIPVPFVAHGNNHVETSSHEPRMGTIEIFDVISYVAKGKEDYDGGSARGPQVTVNDKNGAQADIDIQVNYSLDPKYATDLYKDYGKQTTFVKSVAAVDVRSVPREVSGRFDTIQLLTDRSKYTAAVQKALTAKWKGMGLRVEQVSVQEVRYPQSITSKYAEAQAAEIDKQKALNEQEVEKTKAETKRIKAQGEADANKVLNDSLTDNVLRQHYIDALQNADQLIVTPEGSNTLIQPK